MDKFNKWIGILNLLGIVAFFIGVLDPLEGWPVVLTGSVVITFCSYLRKDKRRVWYLTGSVLIGVGVLYMVILSSLGGIEPHDKSRWWLLPLVVYPAGWLVQAVILFTGALRKKAKPTDPENTGSPEC